MLPQYHKIPRRINKKKKGSVGSQPVMFWSTFGTFRSVLRWLTVAGVLYQEQHYRHTEAHRTDTEI